MSKSRKLRIPPRLMLDSGNLDSWSKKIRGFLIATQSWSLRQLENQVKRDGSSSPGVLAGIRIVKQVVPCPVEWYCIDTFYLLRFRLGKGTYEYIENPPPSEFHDTLMNADTQWHETFDPRNQDVWMIVPKGKPFEKYFPVSMLKQAIESMISDEQDRLVQLRGSTLASTNVKPLISLALLPISKVYQIRSFFKLLPALIFC